jgi:hypothetical protein
MYVEVETEGHIYNPIAATGKNCEALCSIVKDVLSPNMRVAQVK